MSGYGMGRALANRGHDVTLLDPATGRAMRLEDFQTNAASMIPPTVAELGQYSQGDMILQSLTSSTVREADVIVFGLHGVPGEDGIMQAVLDLQGKRYTGSNARSTAVCFSQEGPLSGYPWIRTTGLPEPWSS